MRKTMRFLLMLMMCVMVASPLTVSARSYKVTGTDMTVEIDDSMWYVFTRDNLVGNPELEELGLEYDAFYSNMSENNIYVDACLFYEDGDYVEVLVMMHDQDDYVNLSNYNDERILTMGKISFKDIASEENTSVYEDPDDHYKYYRIEYTDSDLYLVQYVTVINGYSYDIQFQSPYEYDKMKYQGIQEVIDGIHFDVDPSLKEKNSGFPAEGIVRIIGAGVIGGLGGLIGYFAKQKAKKKTGAANGIAGAAHGMVNTAGEAAITAEKDSADKNDQTTSE